MNSNESKQLELIETELFPEPDFFEEESDRPKTVLVKHDYYSEDTEHGRQLLKAFLTIIANSETKTELIIFAGRGVRLLDAEHDLARDTENAIKNSLMALVCEESAGQYGIQVKPPLSEITAENMAEEILKTRNLTILE